jgi:hypothetical protein
MFKLIVILAAALVFGYYAYMQFDAAFGEREAPPVACTMEAKICPDGSAVGRTGPNCEFAACPTITQ